MPQPPTQLLLKIPKFIYRNVNIFAISYRQNINMKNLIPRITTLHCMCANKEKILFDCKVNGENGLAANCAF